MSRPAKDPITLPDGRKVSASLKLRGNILFVVFPDPSRPGKYLERSTREKHQLDAWPAAKQIITLAYFPTERPSARAVTWDRIVKELPTAKSFRPRTIEMYEESIRLLRRFLTTSGPADVTEQQAKLFKHLYQTTPFTRGKGEASKGYPRSAQTVRNGVHRLSCLWSHLKEMGFANSNPWEKVTKPPAPKKAPTAPTEEDFAEFFEWVDGKEWELMSVYLRVKCLAGCRTLDLCSLKASQFDRKRGILTILHEQDKTHRERRIPLPADLAARLRKIAGTDYLWDTYTETARKLDGRASESFRPLLLYWAVRRLFVEYSAAHPDRPHLTAHALRRRAITLLVKATGSIDQTAAALGVTSATARKHYLDQEQAFDSDKLFRDMAGALIPR